MPKQLGLVPLLKQFGFDPSLRTKLVRHHDQIYGIHEQISEGWFDLYQCLLPRPVFHNCDQIVSFSSESGSRARFIGVYRVLGYQPVPAKVVPKECPYKEISSTSTLQYRLERDPRFHDLEHRVVIDWGKGAIKWDQHLTDKIVIEVLPPGRSLPEFSDYLDFTLTYQELVRLYRHPTAHRDWYSSLSAVAGVYLILSESSGRQYVGSACGTTGIWGRWISAYTLWQQATTFGERFPIVFSDANDCANLLYWGQIENLIVDENGTTFAFSTLRPISTNRRTQDLVLKSTGQKIAPHFIRPYALVQTPKFLG